MPQGEAWYTDAPFCEDLVHPDDRAALVTAFELAEEQQREAAKRKEETETQTTATGGGGHPSEEEEDDTLEPPAVLVRVNPRNSKGGPPRLFRVSVTQCGPPHLFACLWRDATRLRRSAAAQEALVCGLSDCMSTVVWVFDPIPSQETRIPGGTVAKEATEPTRGDGEQIAVNQQHAKRVDGTYRKVGSTCAYTDGSFAKSQSHGLPAEELGDSAGPRGTTSMDDVRHGTPFYRPGKQEQQNQHTQPSTALPRGTGRYNYPNNNNKRRNSKKQLYSSPHSQAVASAACPCATTDVNVAPASLCPVYQTEVGPVHQERIEAPAHPVRAPWNARGMNLHGNHRLFTVAGGAPLLQIEREGPVGFLMEHSKAILQRLTGRIVLGREPFSMLSAGDYQSPAESQESNWTDFFLEPGKTQLLECVRRLRTKGESFSLELPYERSDGTIRYYLFVPVIRIFPPMYICLVHVHSSQPSGGGAGAPVYAAADAAAWEFLGIAGARLVVLLLS